MRGDEVGVREEVRGRKMGGGASVQARAEGV